MPGLAASALILNELHFQDTFEIYLLEWEIPLDNESLTHAKRISEKIKHEIQS
jgi:hypothetical protein